MHGLASGRGGWHKMDDKPASPLIGPLIAPMAAITAFSLWGLYPLYFKAIDHVPAFEVNTKYPASNKTDERRC